MDIANHVPCDVFSLGKVYTKVMLSNPDFSFNELDLSLFVEKKCELLKLPNAQQEQLQKVGIYYSLPFFPPIFLANFSHLFLYRISQFFSQIFTRFPLQFLFFPPFFQPVFIFPSIPEPSILYFL
eukprot:Phypoly_transcript_05434.p2 GENE.Phypoly_transcript_05434~~Phypoly_transcript_05434.p2  ORF type:complete len:125 (+),score=25.26 Phypoly_transcript_05434:566-940(+)